LTTVAAREGPHPYRWAVLGAVTLAQMSFSAFSLGLPALAPAIRVHYDASLGATGAFLGAVSLGLAATLLPWGLMTDRLGERAAMTIGLFGCAACLAAGSFAPTLTSLAALLSLAAGLGACVNAAVGRAVLVWFTPDTRGFAFSIRQAGMMVAAAGAAATMPRLATAFGLRVALLALAAGCLLGAAVSLAAVRARDVLPGAEAVPAGLRRSLLDRTLWRLSVGSSFACVAQTACTGFVVLFLHEVRHMGIVTAAEVLAASQILGGAVRVASGVWSDRLGSRVVPLRRISLWIAIVVSGTALLEHAPLALLVPLFVLAGGLSMGWNTVSFAAAVELGGATRAGATLGFQQAMLALVAAATPPVFALGVEQLSWQAAWTLAGVLPAVGWLVLRGLPLSPAYRARRMQMTVEP
jgi:MFS family permease